MPNNMTIIYANIPLKGYDNMMSMTTGQAMTYVCDLMIRFSDVIGPPQGSGALSLIASIANKTFSTECPSTSSCKTCDT